MSATELTLPVSSATSLPTRPGEDADFERRWSAWKEEGLAQDRRFRRTLQITALIAALALTGALVGGLLFL